MSGVTSGGRDEVVIGIAFRRKAKLKGVWRKGDVVRAQPHHPFFNLPASQDLCRAYQSSVEANREAVAEAEALYTPLYTVGCRTEDGPIPGPDGCPGPDLSGQPGRLTGKPVGGGPQVTGRLMSQEARARRMRTLRATWRRWAPLREAMTRWAWRTWIAWEVIRAAQESQRDCGSV